MRLSLSRYEEYTPVWAPLMLRLALGIIFIAHGSQKVFGAFGGGGISEVTKMVTFLGFKPVGLWTWLLALTEFLGGLAVLVGLFTRLAALGLIVVMVVAIIMVHGRYGLFLPKGFEYNLAIIAMALSLFASGGGKLSLDWYISQWRKDRRS